MEAIKKQNKTIPLHLIPPAAKENSTYLLHPVLDPLMMGGLGIFFFIGMHFFVEPSASLDKIGWVMFYLGFAVNFPHFMASYVLLYKEYRSEIFTNWKFTWAAIVAPTLLVATLLGLSLQAVSQGSITSLGYLPSLMFFLVGHHYVKQIYGCMMVSSAKKKFYFSKIESRALWMSMYAVWMMSFISTNAYSVNTHTFYGIQYTTLGLDKLWLQSAYIATFAATCFFLATMVKKYIRDGRVMPLSAWAALTSIYVWYIPAFYHAHYFYMIPFFHSLQYLLFSTSFAKNKAQDLASSQADEARARMTFLKKFGGFLGLTIVTGYLFWEYLPNFLDAKMVRPELLGPTIFMFYFQIFLNIHHYLIDNVIWRKDNQQMKRYL